MAFFPVGLSFVSKTQLSFKNKFLRHFLHLKEACFPISISATPMFFHDDFSALGLTTKRRLLCVNLEFIDLCNSFSTTNLNSGGYSRIPELNAGKIYGQKVIKYAALPEISLFFLN